MTTAEEPFYEASAGDMFVRMFLAQKDSQEHVFVGQHPATLAPVEQMAYLSNAALALVDEVHEALAETGWKPWAESNHINREAYRGELVDVMHFFINMMLVAGIGPIELCNAFLEKNARNAKRQEEGYDGVTDKCPSCHRAYDDRGVLCTRENFDPEKGIVGPTYCDKAKVYDDLSGYQLRYGAYMMAKDIKRIVDNTHISPMDAGGDPAAVA